METDKENTIMVHIGEGQVIMFLAIGIGLYIWKQRYKSNILNKQVSSCSFLSLVAKNKSNYTKCELDRKLYINIGMPGYKKFFKALDNNLMKDCSLMVDDAKRCLNVYGRELAKLKGSKTRNKSSKTQDMVVIPLPLTLIDT